MSAMQIRTRGKNLFLSLIITIALWIGLAYLILMIPPNSLIIVGGFLIGTLLALFLSFSLVLGNAERGLIVSVTLTSYLLLRIYDQDTIINIILLVALAVTAGFHLHQRKE